MTDADAASIKRVGGIIRWLKQRAMDHEQAAAQAGGTGYPAGQESMLRASECRKVAEEIARFWT